MITAGVMKRVARHLGEIGNFCRHSESRDGLLRPGSARFRPIACV
jgi:hypothetical protein